MLSPYMSPVERVWFYSLRILCGLILLFLLMSDVATERFRRARAARAARSAQLTKGAVA